MKFISYSEKDTIKFAASMAQEIEAGDVLLFYGDLGAGKSVFSRALIRTLIKDSEAEVPSPTFTLVQNYDCDKGLVWHFDLYRLEHPDEIFELGFEEALSGGISIIEWAERLGESLPYSYTKISITIDHEDPNKRIIEVSKQ